MGSPLTPYACDNCIVGDASAWTLPLLALVVACGAAAAFAWLRSRSAPGRRSLSLRLSALLLLAGPPVAVVALMGDTTHGRTHCGSALSASLLRGVPDDAALDAAQRGCLARGEQVVAVATAWGAAALAAAALAGAAGGLPPRRRALVA